MTTGLRRPLVLTGPPAAGKSTTGEALARRRERAAYIDVDDVRQFVVAGAQAPWRGVEGAAQALLGTLNACAMARNFRAAGFDTVIVEVLTPETAAALRDDLPECLVVHLVVDVREARRRAATRPAWLTEQEFDHLHRRDSEDPPRVDVTLDVSTLDAPAQQAAVEAVWASGRPTV
jgi:gluconate kinase